MHVISDLHSELHDFEFWPSGLKQLMQSLKLPSPKTQNLTLLSRKQCNNNAEILQAHGSCGSGPNSPGSEGAYPGLRFGIRYV